MIKSNYSSNRDTNFNKRLLAAFIVTCLFMFIEATGGWLSGSLTLLADAGHMLTDVASLLMALLAMRFASRQPNNHHTFGYLRLTTLAALFNALALFFITTMIACKAINRFLTPQYIDGWVMMFITIVGLGANIFSYWLLHSGNSEKNINLRAAALHVLGDLLGSIGAIIAATIIICTNWLLIDPLLSILLSYIVLRSSWRLLNESLHELLEGTPKQFDIEKFKYEIMRDIPELNDIHHVHLWQIGEKLLMTFHVQVILSLDNENLLHHIKEYLLERYHIGHATIQMESFICKDNICLIHKNQTSISKN